MKFITYFLLLNAILLGPAMGLPASYKKLDSESDNGPPSLTSKIKDMFTGPPSFVDKIKNTITGPPRKQIQPGDVISVTYKDSSNEGANTPTTEYGIFIQYHDEACVYYLLTQRNLLPNLSDSIEYSTKDSSKIFRKKVEVSAPWVDFGMSACKLGVECDLNLIVRNAVKIKELGSLIYNKRLNSAEPGDLILVTYKNVRTTQSTTPPATRHAIFTECRRAFCFYYTLIKEPNLQSPKYILNSIEYSTEKYPKIFLKEAVSVSFPPWVNFKRRSCRPRFDCEFNPVVKNAVDLNRMINLSENIRRFK